MVIIWNSFPLFVKVKRIDYFPWKFRGNESYLICSELLEHGSQVSKYIQPQHIQYTSKLRSTYLISGAHIFHFRSMLPKIKYFFQFRKKISISGAGSANSGAWIFLFIYLSICLSIYLSACLPVCLSNYLEIKWFCR